MAPLAAAVALAQVRAALGPLDPTEERAVEEAVRSGLAAMPDVTREGVRAASIAADLTLSALCGTRFLRASTKAQAAAVERGLRLGVPGVAEYARLTRGLALLSVVDLRCADGAGHG